MNNLQAVLIFDLEGRSATSFPRPINNGRIFKNAGYPGSVDRRDNRLYYVRFPTLQRQLMFRKRNQRFLIGS
jgi:hypothetical protein